MINNSLNEYKKCTTSKYCRRSSALTRELMDVNVPKNLFLNYKQLSIADLFDKFIYEF